MRRQSERPAAEQVFTELYRRHYGAVLTFCIRRSESMEEAQDAAAEAFTVAWRRLDAAPDPSLPWLLAIARRTLANRRRGGARRVALVARIASSGPPPATPSHSEVVHDRFAVRDAFARLSPADREVLALWAWDALPAGEAAATLEVSTTAYSVRLLRAKRRLRKHLEDLGDDLLERPPLAVSTTQTGSADA